MEYGFKLILIFLPLMEAISISITCTFGNYSLPINTISEPTKSYYECDIRSAVLLDRSTELISVETSSNKKSNDDVQLIDFYVNNKVKHIPNILFRTFPNCEYFYMNQNFGLEEIKQRYFEGANNLRVVRIPNNEIKHLDKRVFSSARNIEIINLKNNLIENFHKLAFDGLPQLLQIYLQQNRIHQLSVDTFSLIDNLKTLDLTDNYCIDQIFQDKNFNGLEACDLFGQLRTGSSETSQLSQDVENLKNDGNYIRASFESLKHLELEPLKSKANQLNITIKELDTKYQENAHHLEVLTRNAESIHNLINNITHEMWTISREDKLHIEQSVSGFSAQVNSSLTELFEKLNTNQRLFNSSKNELLRISNNTIHTVESFHIELDTLRHSSNDFEEALNLIRDELTSKIQETYQNVTSNSQLKTPQENLKILTDSEEMNYFQIYIYIGLASIVILYIIITGMMIYAYKILKAQNISRNFESNTAYEVTEFNNMGAEQ